MNGFFRNDGTWIQREHLAPQGSQQEALCAAIEAVERVKQRESNASAELKELLCKYPLLRQEQKRETDQHPLNPLVDYYTAEVLGINCQAKDQKD
jgi:hypothetical protein